MYTSSVSVLTYQGEGCVPSFIRIKKGNIGEFGGFLSVSQHSVLHYSVRVATDLSSARKGMDMDAFLKSTMPQNNTRHLCNPPFSLLVQCYMFLLLQVWVIMSLVLSSL